MNKNAELLKVIEPKLLSDFCGYNEEAQAFDIVLATKEIIEAKEQECEELKKQLTKYKQALDEIESYCNEQNLKYDTTACAILDIIDKIKEGGGNEKHN